MEALAHNNIHDFAAIAGPLLRANPVHHSVHLTTMDLALRGETAATTLITLHDNGTLVGAVTRLQNRPLHIAAMPTEAVPALVAALRGQNIAAVTGPLDRVEAFRALWREGGREIYRLRLYQLGDLVVPAVPGEPRLASAEDDELITEWWVAFVAELDGLEREQAEAVMRTARDMPAGHVIWVVAGEPVAWAATTRPVDGVSRVGPVYTPPRWRRQGYGAAVSAAVCRWAREAGAEHVVLTADVFDPAPNAVYQGIGFRVVSDWTQYSWD